MIRYGMQTRNTARIKTEGGFPHQVQSMDPTHVLYRDMDCTEGTEVHTAHKDY